MVTIIGIGVATRTRPTSAVISADSPICKKPNRDELVAAIRGKFSMAIAMAWGRVRPRAAAYSAMGTIRASTEGGHRLCRASISRVESSASRTPAKSTRAGGRRAARRALSALPPM